MKRWENARDKHAGPIFNFTRKAIIQQLPTATNLVRWGKSTDPLCPLCKTCPQTNKHVISNCGSPVSLDRYKKRHDEVLTILVEEIKLRYKSYINHKIFADLHGPGYNKVSTLFSSLRPDIAILTSSTIETLELTVCHETNLAKSKQFKKMKYADLQENVQPQYSDLKINRHSIEVTSLAFISDISKLNNILRINVSNEVLNKFTWTAISNSFLIYCNRNTI